MVRDTKFLVSAIDLSRKKMRFPVGQVIGSARMTPPGGLLADSAGRIFANLVNFVRVYLGQGGLCSYYPAVETLNLGSNRVCHRPWPSIPRQFCQLR